MKAVTMHSCMNESRRSDLVLESIFFEPTCALFDLILRFVKIVVLLY